MESQVVHNKIEERSWRHSQKDGDAENGGWAKEIGQAQVNWGKI